MTITVTDLHVDFGRGAAVNHAVDGVSFTVQSGETLAIVGESGSGTTTVARCLAGLQRPTSGEILFDGVPAEYREDRVQMVFQDPFSSLDPRWPVGRCIAEPLRRTPGLSASQRQQAVVAALEAVGLSAEDSDRYPHQFSGGQRQRISIARALIVKPDLLISDEAVSALDVLIQAQVLNVLKEITEQQSFAHVFISHDLSVVNFIASQVLVMHHGRVVERGTREQIFTHPQDPYTISLLEAIPQIDDVPDRA